MVSDDPDEIKNGFGIYRVSSGTPLREGFRHLVFRGEEVIAYLDSERHARILAEVLELKELVEDIGHNAAEEIIAFNIDLFGVIQKKEVLKK